MNLITSNLSKFNFIAQIETDTIKQNKFVLIRLPNRTITRVQIRIHIVRVHIAQYWIRVAQ